MVKPRAEFTGLLDKAEENAQIVARFLTENGRYARVLPHTIAPDIESRWNHVDTGDLEIKKGGLSFRLEIKHWPKIDFNSKEDVPYANVIVDEVYKIEAWHERPLLGYLILNASRSAYLLISNDTKNHWFKKAAYDRSESASRRFYFCPLEYVTFHRITLK